MTLEIHKFKRSAQPSRYCCFHQILSASFVFSIVIMVISKKEVRCVLLTRRYWYYSEKVSKTLQQCF